MKEDDVHNGSVSRPLGAGEREMLHSLGSAGTQAAGLWEFLRDDADSKQRHTNKAARIITSVRLENAATAGAGTAVTPPFERVAHLR